MALKSYLRGVVIKCVSYLYFLNRGAEWEVAYKRVYNNLFNIFDKYPRNSDSFKPSF